jgi:ACS family tartrate transporter-like MFS transporter
MTPEQIAALRRKVAWRILPISILLYLVAYLDRANVGFAKLRMAGDLHFSEEVFGFGIGIFFIGYLILEIPGALLVERWSARKWFARILMTWGFLSASTAFVETPFQFNLARFLLGVAEAGFFPGIVVYFTHWFAARDRARAMSGFIVAVPFSLALGAPLSALLLDVDWLGLRGWQWLFIVEGLPAVVLGVVTLFYLTDRPRHAQWLTPAERDHLESTLAAEAAAKDAVQKVTIGQALRLRNVWLLALGIFANNTGGYALGFWLPTTIKSLSAGSDRASLLFSGLFYLLGIIGVLYAGYSSDRRNERKWHCIAGQVSTGVFLAASAIPGQPFWALLTMTLTASAAATAIGLINIFANLAGYFGNHLFGILKQNGVTDSTCLFLLSCCYLLGAAIISQVTVKAHAPAP